MQSYRIQTLPPCTRVVHHVSNGGNQRSLPPRNHASMPPASIAQPARSIDATMPCLIFGVGVSLSWVTSCVGRWGGGKKMQQARRGGVRDRSRTRRRFVDTREIINNYTPVHDAAARGRSGQLKYALDTLCYPATGRMVSTGDTPMHLGVLCNNLDMIKYLVEAGASPTERNNAGDTPFHYAAQHGQIKAMDKLLKLGQGVEVNLKGGDNETPLHMAARGGHFNTVKFLIANGADVHAKGLYRYTPLHVACSNGHVDIARYLFMECGADMYAKCDFGMTPREIASSSYLQGFLRFAHKISYFK